MGFLLPLSEIMSFPMCSRKISAVQPAFGDARTRHSRDFRVQSSEFRFQSSDFRFETRGWRLGRRLLCIELLGPGLSFPIE